MFYLFTLVFYVFPPVSSSCYVLPLFMWEVPSRYWWPSCRTSCAILLWSFYWLCILYLFSVFSIIWTVLTRWLLDNFLIRQYEDLEVFLLAFSLSVLPILLCSIPCLWSNYHCLYSNPWFIIQGEEFLSTAFSFNHL